ncbi:hypothetical protein OIE66_00125 [Nonomuraea sp. NBC_01738]|uniref:hypothetical protein n=1 Tax=Nonomuraea sp. NBC_01738 TaxID=2976003 RepID=UPI002E113733|nr:hypothetical protein OIE66_00125 [Nonomuraea sp. NBC_01738]
MFLLSVAMLSILSMTWLSGDPPVRDRWHAWPIEQVFPATVPGTSPSGARVVYELAGVAPEASCEAALQPAAARALPGCLTVLRATYTDSTQTFVATAGVVVLEEPPVTLDARWHGYRPPNVRPVAFPGGAAEGFGRKQYVTGAVAVSDDRYLVLAAAGYADGRPYQKGEAPAARLSGVARQLANALNGALTR